MAAIVGRQAELGRVAAAFDRLSDGEPVGVAIEGPAGIGKSTIWAEASAALRRRGWLVLTARPAEAESQLTLGVLGDLLDPIDAGDIGGLPTPQRQALDVALLRADASGAAPEARVLGTAVRNLLEHVGRRGPAVLAIDDVQWVDAASAAVLSFAIRRVAAAPVGLLVARRTPMPSAIDLDKLLPSDRRNHVAVGPMALGSLNEVLAARMGAAPSRATLVRIQDASGGNPLFALEIVRALEARGIPPAGDPLPMPADVRELIRDRLAALPQPARDVLLDVAILGTADEGRLDAIEGRDVRSELESGLADGLLQRDGNAIAFAHPLYAAAALESAEPATRRAAHGRMAGTATSIEEGALHRALAAVGPDERIAAALDDAAREARRRAAPMAAADLLRLALERTPAADVAAAARRQLALAEALTRAGDAPAAVAELEGVVAGADSTARIQARLALATIRYETDASPAAAVRLATAAAREAAGDPALEAHAYAVLAAVDWDDIGRHTEYLERAGAAIDRVREPDPVVEGLILLARCGEDVRTGRPLDPALVERGLELERIAPAPAVADRFSASLGTWLKLLGRFDEARVWLERTRQAAIDEGDDGSLAYSLSHLPELEVSTGHWDAAERVAREHLEVAEATGLDSQRDQALYNLALVQVHQGGPGARDAVEAAIEAASAADDAWMLSGVLPLLGLLELSLGDPAAAVEPLARGSEIRDALGSAEPRRSGPDLVEALLATGAVDRAEAIQREIDERVARFDRPTAKATAARSRGLVFAARGDLEAARTALLSALEHDAPASVPFERARTLLALGQVRRRLRERGAARDAFEEARSTFDRLGARPWAERAEAELLRTGIRRGAGLELTETERRVAELAASGLTNREVAAALFMSPKTVDANLGRAYAKLGIRSRAELGAVIARRAQT